MGRPLIMVPPPYAALPGGSRDMYQSVEFTSGFGHSGRKGRQRRRRFMRTLDPELT
jgi:hypothetical protein